MYMASLSLLLCHFNSLSTTMHAVNWDNSMVVDKELKWHRRRLKEAMYIKKYNFYQDQGLALSPIWASDILAT